MMRCCWRNVVAFLGLPEMGLNPKVNPLWGVVLQFQQDRLCVISGIFGLSGISG